MCIVAVCPDPDPRRATLRLVGNGLTTPVSATNRPFTRPPRRVFNVNPGHALARDGQLQ